MVKSEMIRLDVRADFKPALDMLKGLESGLRDKVIGRALNRVADKAKVAAGSDIHREYNLASAKIKQQIRVTRASWANGMLRATITATGRHGRSLNVIEYAERKVTLAQARKRRRDTTLYDMRVKVKNAGGYKTLKQPAWASGKPFIMTGRAGGTFIAAREPGRTKTGKEKVRGIYTIDVPWMFSSRKIGGALVAKIKSDFPTELARAFAAVKRGY